MRGRLAPPDVPLGVSRARRFDELVIDAVTQLGGVLEERLPELDVVVMEVPPDPGSDRGPGGTGGDPRSGTDPGADPGMGAGGAAGSRGATAGGDGDRAVVLAEVLEASPTRPRPQLVVYRRPVEARASDLDELGDLVLDVVLEALAEHLGVDPEDLDPPEE